MEAFCSNTLSQTQCNGLTRTAFSAAVSIGLIKGLAGFMLGGYLALLYRKARCITLLAWIIALEGLFYLITVSLEASSRFNPGSLVHFLLVDKVAAGLGIVSLILFFIFQLAAASFLANRYDRNMIPVVIFFLTPLAGVTLAFNIIALQAVSYEERPAGIRAGARDLKDFLDPSIKALAFMLSFMTSVFFVHILLYGLLLRRKIKEQRRKEERRTKAISSFSNSTLAESEIVGTKMQFKPQFDSVLPSALLSILKTCLAFLSANTIVLQRVLGLLEYLACVFAVLEYLRSYKAEKVGSGNFFGQLESNASYASSTGSCEVKILPPAPTSPSILRRAGMASFGVGVAKPASSPHIRSKWATQPTRQPSVRPPLKPPGQRDLSRMSYATQSAFSSIAPEDSASTAAFMPRPPLPPRHMRTRTTHGPNGSELAPLREDLVEKFNRSS